MAQIIENYAPTRSVATRPVGPGFADEWAAPATTGFEFELQPLMRTVDRSIFGYEYLYRGDRSIRWESVDEAVLDFLCKGNAPVSEKAMFVNLSHQSLIDIPGEIFIYASFANNVHFEISEAFADKETFAKVVTKANALSAQGVQFAIDDFGSGLDGFRRLYALDQVSAIKIDGELVWAAYQREHAASNLRAMVAHWKGTGMVTVAEGIESQALLSFARDLQFDVVQGFYVDDLCSTNLGLHGGER